jgi:hypothetical protein
MKTEIHQQSITFSKAATILKCCAIAFLIGSVFSFSNQISIQEFITNILEWDSI